MTAAMKTVPLTLGGETVQVQVKKRSKSKKVQPPVTVDTPQPLPAAPATDSKDSGQVVQTNPPQDTSSPAATQPQATPPTVNAQVPAAPATDTQDNGQVVQTSPPTDEIDEDDESDEDERRESPARKSHREWLDMMGNGLINIARKHQTIYVTLLDRLDRHGKDANSFNNQDVVLSAKFGDTDGDRGGDAEKVIEILARFGIKRVLVRLIRSTNTFQFVWDNNVVPKNEFEATAFKMNLYLALKAEVRSMLPMPLIPWFGEVRHRNGRLILPISIRRTGVFGREFTLVEVAMDPTHPYNPVITSVEMGLSPKCSMKDPSFIPDEKTRTSIKYGLMTDRERDGQDQTKNWLHRVAKDIANHESVSGGDTAFAEVMEGVIDTLITGKFWTRVNQLFTAHKEHAAEATDVVDML